MIPDSLYWYLHSAFEKFEETTGICIALDSTAMVDIEYLLELFITLEPVADAARGETGEFLKEVGLVDTGDQIMMYETPKAEGVALIESLMKRANDAFNWDRTLLIQGVMVEED